MKSKIIMLWFFLAGCLCRADAPSDNILQVSRIEQETSFWCWAASGQMIMSYLKTTVSQCDQACKFFDVPDCCSSDTPDVCVNGGWPQFEKYGFSYDYTHDAALAFSEIQEQIKANRPVAFSWHWIDADGNPEGGHMMVIYGWETVNDVQYVLVHDPQKGAEYEGEMTVEAFIAGNDYTHWNDFYNITKKVQ